MVVAPERAEPDALMKELLGQREAGYQRAWSSQNSAASQSVLLILGVSHNSEGFIIGKRPVFGGNLGLKQPIRGIYNMEGFGYAQLCHGSSWPASTGAGGACRSAE